MIITEQDIEPIILKLQYRHSTLFKVDDTLSKALGLVSALEHNTYKHYARFKRLIYDVKFKESESRIVKALLVISYDYDNRISIKNLNNNLFNARIKVKGYDIVYSDDLDEVNPLNFAYDVVDKDNIIQKFLNSSNGTDEERSNAICEYLNYDYTKIDD